MRHAHYLSIGLIAAVLVAFAPPVKAQAPTACPLGTGSPVLCFDDLTDGPPIVTANFPISVAAGLESATVTFATPALSGPFPRSYALLETGGDFNPPNSDVATVLGPGTMLFQSDIFSSPPTFGPPAGTLPETGGFQEFAVDPSLDVFIRSDVGGGPEAAPEASTLLLVSLGLAVGGFAAAPRRRTRDRSSGASLAA